jgi:hypothetical protein
MEKSFAFALLCLSALASSDAFAQAERTPPTRERQAAAGANGDIKRLADAVAADPQMQQVHRDAIAALTSDSRGQFESKIAEVSAKRAEIVPAIATRLAINPPQPTSRIRARATKPGQVGFVIPKSAVAAAAIELKWRTFTTEITSIPQMDGMKIGTCGDVPMTSAAGPPMTVGTGIAAASDDCEILRKRTTTFVVPPSYEGVDNPSTMRIVTQVRKGYARTDGAGAQPQAKLYIHAPGWGGDIVGMFAPCCGGPQEFFEENRTAEWVVPFDIKSGTYKLEFESRTTGPGYASASLQLESIKIEVIYKGQ